MNKTIAQLTILAFYLILPASPVIAETMTVHEFMVLYSNNVNGEIEPCG